MTWADFYLICFVVGFALSLISFLGGGARWRFHLPHWPHGVGHLHGPLGAGHVTGVHTPVAAGHAPSVGAGGPLRAATDASISPFNFVTFTAFLAWFGGTGFLLTRYAGVWFLMGLGIAVTSGLAGGGIVSLFLSKVLALLGVAAIILGHIAIRQIRRTGDRGRRQARAGLILGYLVLVVVGLLPTLLLLLVSSTTSAPFPR